MLDLEAIKARCEAATPPPWDVMTGKKLPYTQLVGSLYAGYSQRDHTEHWVHIVGEPRAPGASLADDDADFIAHAREDIPALIAKIERLQLDYAEAMRQYDEAQRRACAAEAEVERLREQGQRRMDELITSLIRAVDSIGRPGEIPAVDA